MSDASKTYRHLLPPEPQIELYKEGFEEEDPFGRKSTSAELSRLVEQIETPMVIALDGKWGCGKTYFLKRWVGQHGNKNSEGATTVYFDAFENDFLDDPLISLTSIIGQKIDASNQPGAWEKIQNAAAKLALPVFRIGLAVAPTGVSGFLGPILNAFLAAASKELQKAAEEFWKKETGKNAAMLELREALAALTKPENGAIKPLVVVVDELDRCRPDYALALLEIIKHLFSVPHVHFVLGVNLQSLENSVHARYGAGIDAEEYLRRFIMLRMELPKQVDAKNGKQMGIAAAYFEDIAQKMNIPPKTAGAMKPHIALAENARGVSLRDVNQIANRMNLSDLDTIEKRSLGYRSVFCSLVLTEVLDPVLAKSLVNGSPNLEAMEGLFGFSKVTKDENNPMRDHYYWSKRIHNIWQYIASNGSLQSIDGRDPKDDFPENPFEDNVNGIPQYIHQQFFNKFAFFEPSPPQ
ncbi:MAG: KAP family P-loop NTPase fold protein [Mangrovicoccus sp.]